VTPAVSAPEPILVPADVVAQAGPAALVWAADAEQELKKIPFFVRGKARRNTEKFAAEHGLAVINLATLYDAKSHFAR
jgi:light-independent protochlorophyllide reductase subunit B